MELAKAFKRCIDLKDKYIHVENGGDYFIERDGETLKIFFEWSDGIEDWISNFNFLAIPWKPYKNMPHTWFCHRGFLKVWKAIEPYIASHILDPKNTKIEVVGYSHGAPIALLCYEYCVFNRPDIEIEGAGFGCPRVFWGYIPRTIKKRFANFKVVRNGDDIVCHVPPALLGFRHVGELIKIGQTNPINDHFSSEYILRLEQFDCQ